MQLGGIADHHERQLRNARLQTDGGRKRSAQQLERLGHDLADVERCAPAELAAAVSQDLIDERAAKGGGKKAKKAKAAKPAKTETDPAAPKPAKKAAVKKAASKPKSDAVSKARAPVASSAKTSAAKPPAAAKATPKKSAGKARG